MDLLEGIGDEGSMSPAQLRDAINDVDRFVDPERLGRIATAIAMQQEADVQQDLTRLFTQRLALVHPPASDGTANADATNRQEAADSSNDLLQATLTQPTHYGELLQQIDSIDARAEASEMFATQLSRVLTAICQLPDQSEREDLVRYLEQRLRR